MGSRDTISCHYLLLYSFSILTVVFGFVEYSFMVDSLSEEFRLLVSRYLNPIFEPEPFVSGSDSSDCSSDSDLSYRKSKSSVPDAKKRGGLMKLAQAFGGHRSAPKASPPPASTNKVKLKTEDVWDTPDSSEAEQKNRKSTSKSKVSLVHLTFSK